MPGADRSFPVWRGFAAGVGSFVVGAAVVAGLFALDVGPALADGGRRFPARSAVDGLGWVVYSAHFVRIEAGTLSFDLLQLFDSLTRVPTPVYRAVPPAVLVAGGRLVADGDDGGARRAVDGSLVVLGYLPAAILGAVAVSNGASGPHGPTAVLLAGVGYPLAFGALGGILARWPATEE